MGKYFWLALFALTAWVAHDIITFVPERQIRITCYEETFDLGDKAFSDKRLIFSNNPQTGLTWYHALFRDILALRGVESMLNIYAVMIVLLMAFLVDWAFSSAETIFRWVFTARPTRPE